jgi:hypothetical protein
MAAVAQEIETGERLRTFLPSVEERKGLYLSHALGFSMFAELALNIFNFNIPFTPANSIPIRLIAIWLLIDRTGRIGRLRLGMWDAVILGFVFLTGIGCLYNATFYPSVPTSFEDFRKFVGLFVNAYLYFLVVREGLNRRGFRPDIAINWLIAGFTWSALVGIMQTLGIAGARSWSLIYSNPLLSFIREQSPEENFASGTASWWNSMALEMLVAFALVFGPTFIRKPKWWEWVLGALFMGAFIATQSRGGLMAFAACACATFFWYLYHRKYLMAVVVGATVTVGVVVWVFAVFALKIEKFTTTLEGEKVKGSVYNQSISGRLLQQRQLVTIGSQVPIFGTGPHFGTRMVTQWSSYTMSGPTDTMYGFMFAQFGILGLAFLTIMQAYMIAFVRSTTAYRPYAFAAFFVGVAFTIHGLVEFLLYSRTFMVMNVLVALAGATNLASEKGLPPFKRFVKMVPNYLGARPAQPAAASATLPAKGPK